MMSDGDDDSDDDSENDDGEEERKRRLRLRLRLRLRGGGVEEQETQRVDLESGEYMYQSMGMEWNGPSFAPAAKIPAFCCIQPSFKSPHS